MKYYSGHCTIDAWRYNRWVRLERFAFEDVKASSPDALPNCIVRRYKAIYNGNFRLKFQASNVVVTSSMDVQYYQSRMAL